jgi:DNA-binding SARP family transcriptional activator
MPGTVNAAMKVRVLGPLEVLGPSGWGSPSAAKRRQVLAVLALAPGEVVSTDRISDALWGEVVPASAAKIVQNHVLGLRRAHGASFVTTRPDGYALGISEQATDAQAFELLARGGLSALERAQVGEALGALDDALGLWRGRPFPELEAWAPACAEAARLEELHRGAVENRLDAQVSNGGHVGVIADLEAAVAAEPLRELRWELLMVALYRSGRQTEALRAFQRARSLLVEELGIEPGPALRELDRAIAAQDDSLGAVWEVRSSGSMQPRQALAVARRGAVQRLAGDESYRVTIQQASRLARETGDDEALIGAAMGGLRRAGGRASGVVDEELVELLETTTARARDDRAMAQLLSALGQELAASSDRAKPRSMSDRALEAARRTGDAAVISEVLARRSIALAGPDLLDERLAATEENVRIAVHVDDTLSWWAALFTRIAATIEIGDITEVDRRLAELRDATDTMDVPPARWGMLITEGWHQLLRGRLGAAERSALEAYNYGTVYAQPDALGVYAGQLMNIRRSQGRLVELEPRIRAALDQPPMNPSTRPLAAEALAHLGDGRRAASLLREELDASVAAAPGQYWLTIVCAWATVAARVGDSESARHLRDLLDPYVDLVCFNGAFVVGSVALFHAMLTHTLGDRRSAEAALQTALRMHKQLDAPLLVARTEALAAEVPR